MEAQDRIEDSWTGELFDLYLGGVTAEALHEAAATSDERCEAFYYVGIKALLEGDLDAARTAWQSCVAMKRANVLESDFAQIPLRKLEPTR